MALAACNSLTPTDPTVTATALPTDTPVPAPTITPTPLPSGVVLISSDQANSELAKQYQLILAELAQQSNLTFEVRDSLFPEMVTPELKVVVALPPDPGLSALVAAAPQTQFVAIDIAGLQPASNLTVIGSGETGHQVTGFVAGYLAAMVTPGWRIGVISQATAEGQAIRDGFINGAHFYCGLCRDDFPPYNYYPVNIEILPSSDEADWQNALQTLVSQNVTTVFLPADVNFSILLPYLAQAELNYIGEKSPPQELAPRWVATISSDPIQIVRDSWSEIVTGQSAGKNFPVLRLVDVNSVLLSPGKEALVNNLLTNIAAGEVNVGSVQGQ